MYNFEIIVGFVISMFANCQGMSKSVFQLAYYFREQSEIVFISDSFPDAIPDRFRHLFQLSFIPIKSEGDVLDQSFYNKMAANYSHSVKIIVALPRIPETMNVVAQIGGSPKLIARPSQASLIVVWPHIPVDELEANRTLEANFKTENISKYFTLNRDLFVIFNTKSEPNMQNIKTFRIYEVYSVNKQFIYSIVHSITWRCPNCSAQATRRLDLRGQVIKFEGVQDPEYNDDTLFLDRNDTSTDVEFNSSSLSVRIVELMKIPMNFTIKPVKSDIWGRRFANGTIIGVIEDVHDGTVDVGITTTAMLPWRAELVGFLPPTDEYVIAAFFRPPSLNAIRDIFMQPFEPDLWAAVIATWLTLASSMILFTFIRKKVGAHDKIDPNANGPEPDFTQDSMIWALATACQQGWDEHPSALSLRAIFISGSFTAVIAYAGYSAAIVSTLSVRVDPIQNPTALVKSNLRIGMRDGFFREIVPENQSTTGRDIVTDLYRRISSKKEEQYVNISTGIRLLKTYPYAFLTLKEAFYDILKIAPSKNPDVDICGIKELRILKQGFKAGMFTHKMSPFREFFRLILILIRERGVLWRIRNEFTYTRRCLETSDNAGRALGPNDVFTAFMILLGGYILSTFFLVIEKLICLYKYNYMYVITP